MGGQIELALSEKDKNHRWRSVYNKLTEDNAIASYENYISEIMRGKNVNFNYDTFKKLVEITAPYFLQSSTNKKGLLNNSLWTPSSEGEVIIDNLYDVDDIKRLESSDDRW